jgi:putative flippase GtrA
VSQFLRFCIGGVIGFLVDAGVLQLLLSALDADPYLARLVSFLCAMTATWIYNRRVTFAGQASHQPVREWARYAVAMAGGFALNYGVYAALVYFVPLVHSWPVLGVAAGSIAGLAANWLSSRFWVFARPRAAP